MAAPLGGGGRAAAGSAILPNVRITADVTNNAVLVYASADSQRVVEQTIRQIDRPQRQIAIEATIAEVTLNDQLNYGVQFFLASQKGSISNTISGVSPSNTGVEAASNAVNAAAGALLGRVLPGFNFLIGSENSPRVILDALHGITNVKVLSNPSLVVLDNQAATLQVGDQVPFSTGTATVLTANNTVVNTIDYKNTGIILRVLPRANANGNIVLDIEQEISNVAAGSTQSLTPPRQELDRRCQRPDRAARRPDQRDREQEPAGHSPAGFNPRRRGCILAPKYRAGANRADSVHPPDRAERPGGCPCHRRGNAQQDEQPAGRHQQPGGRAAGTSGPALSA